jgi:hypothetical protein
MKREDRENPFAGMRATRPSPELGEYVLRAAASAVGTEVIDPTIWDRVWNSRGLRVAWGVVVVLLLLAHMAVGSGPQAPGSTPRGGVASLEQDHELAELLRLERIEISPRAEAIALGRRRTTRSDS